MSSICIIRMPLFRSAFEGSIDAFVCSKLYTPRLSKACNLWSTSSLASNTLIELLPTWLAMQRNQFCFQTIYFSDEHHSFTKPHLQFPTTLDMVLLGLDMLIDRHYREKYIKGQATSRDHPRSQALVGKSRECLDNVCPTSNAVD
eukprot:c24472_g2_i1 orf=443-877(+)